MTVDTLVGIYRPGGEEIERDVERLLDFCNATHDRVATRLGGVCIGVGTRAAIGAVTHGTVVQVDAQTVTGWVGDGLRLRPEWSLESFGAPSRQNDCEGALESRRFAIASWNEARRELTLIRDPLGLEPLYYAELGAGGIAFASRAAALVELGELSRAIDVESCLESLLFLPRRPGATMFSQVREVVRASVMQCKGMGRSNRQYWQLGDSDPAALDSTALREAFHRAVRKAMVRSERPAVTVSGGIDSSAVFHVAAKEYGVPLQGTVTAIFPGDANATEDEYIDACLMGSPIRQIRFVPDATVTLSELIRETDEPSAIPMSSIIAGCARIAAKDLGADCLLTGDFGDIIAGKVRRPLEWLVRQRRYTDTWRFSGVDSGRFRHWARFAKNFALGRSSRLRHWAATQRDWNKARLAVTNAVGEVVRRKYALVERINAHMHDGDLSDGDFHYGAERFLDTMVPFALRGHWLVERLSGIRLEHPFADPELVSLSARMPFEWRWDGRMSRVGFRTALADDLPALIANRRSKASFERPHDAYYSALIRECGQGNFAGHLLSILDTSPISFRAAIDKRPVGRYVESQACMCSAWIRMYSGVETSKGI